MTIKQFLQHIRVWMADFPPTHTWVRKTDYKDPPFCLICGAIDRDFNPRDEYYYDEDNDTVKLCKGDEDEH